ncbi:site-specific integrase [Streptomyces cinnamoneus]
MAIADYLDYASRNNAFSTFTHYRSKLLRFEKKHGKRSIRTVDTAMLFEYLYGRHGVTKNCGLRNGGQHRTALQNMLNYAAYRGMCPVVAVPKMNGGARPEQRDWTRYSADEMLRLQDGMPCPRSRIIVAVCINTAMRIDDIFQIRLKNVKLATDDLRVKIQKSKLWDNKPVTLELDHELRRYMTWYTETCGVGQRDDVYLIPGSKKVGLVVAGPGSGYAPNPERPVSYNWAYRRLMATLDAQELPHESGEAWHMLRRSVARLYFDTKAEEGYDLALRMTQALLNHKSVETTEKYLGLKIETIKRDQSLKGQAFLSRGRENVVSIVRPSEMRNA